MDVGLLVTAWTNPMAKTMITQNDEPMLVQCWASHVDGEQTFTIPGFTFHRGGCFFALISIFTVFGRFFYIFTYFV